MNDPLAFFLTWVTYGTWLPGNSRGWTEYRGGWQPGDPLLELSAESLMTEGACRLTPEQRVAVETQIAETCRHRGWHLHAVSCRSNHVHAVITAAETHPKKVRVGVKAWATRRLKRDFDSQRENWWAERGSIHWLFTDESFEAAVLYTVEGQERRGMESKSSIRTPPSGAA